MSHFKDLHKSRHPSYLTMQEKWRKWRVCYRGGDDFADEYLYHIDCLREDKKEFARRKAMTPVPSFARSAINEVKNSVFQHMTNIHRRDGSSDYMTAVNGENGGVDKRHSNMNAFMGCEVLEELLVMGKVGVYVDMDDVPEGATRLDLAQTGARPYLYMYRVEDILNLTFSMPNEESKYQAVMLRDEVVHYDQLTSLPLSTTERIRVVWIDPNDGFVRVAFFDEDGNQMDKNGIPTTEPVRLELRQIPFVMLDIGDGLMADVCQHQIAMLNIVSRAVDYTYKSNYTTYVEQGGTEYGQHFEKRDPDTGEVINEGDTRKMGSTIGQRYPMGANQPNFIAPPTAPSEGAMQLLGQLEGDIRKLINLAVTKLAARESAAAKAFDNNGLEAGMSFVGLVMETAEKEIAIHWAAYENIDADDRQIATVSYPERWKLSTSKEQIDEARELAELIAQIPSNTVRKELWKSLVSMLMQGKLKANKMNIVMEEIEKADFTTGDPETVFKAVELGLVTKITGSNSLGYDGAKEVPAAEIELADRLAKIAASQSQGGFNENEDGEGLENAAQRGVDDLDPTPGESTREDLEDAS